MTCDHFNILLEAHLDGDLRPAEDGVLADHAAACDRCAAELALGRRLLHSLRNVPPVTCPEEVLEASLARIAREDQNRPVTPGRRRRLQVAGRAAFAAIALGAALTGGLLALQTGADAPTYSAEEVAEARRQVEFAFGLVGEAGRSTGLYLREDVFPQHVVHPIGRTLTPQ